MDAADPLRHVACSHCRSPCSCSSASLANTAPAALGASQLSLAPCGHVLCDACTVQATTVDPPACPVCGTQAHFVPLAQASPDLQACFRPLAGLAYDLGTAAGWQTAHLAEQLDYFKQKCAQQKRLLARAGHELQKIKSLKQQVAQLTAENAQLDMHRPEQHVQRGLALAEENQYRPGNAPGPARGQKRKSRTSPDRFARPAPLDEARTDSRECSASLPLRPATHASGRPSSRSSGSLPSNLPQAPMRLSLTPAQQTQTRKRTLQPMPVDEHAAEGEGSLRDRLARFAYAPARSHGPRSSAYAPISVSRPSGRASAAPAPASTPFFYKPPNPAPHSYPHSDRPARNLSAQGCPHEAPFDDYESGPAEAWLMPPPPVPSHAEQQQHGTTAVGAATVRGQQRAPVDPHGRPTARRPFSSWSGTPARAPSPTATATAAVAAAAERAGVSTHRQPFRPASALAGPGVGAGWELRR
ncbi:hypothetical protein JCM3770_005078 [Rhodotorula araucariae]